MAETVNHPEDLNPAASYFRKGKLLKEINYVVLNFFHIHHGMHNEVGHISDYTYCTSYYINVEE